MNITKSVSSDAVEVVGIVAEKETDFLIIMGPKTETLHVRVEPRIKRQVWEYSKARGVKPGAMIREWIYVGLGKLIEETYGVGDCDD